MIGFKEVIASMQKQNPVENTGINTEKYLYIGNEQVLRASSSRYTAKVTSSNLNN